MDELVKLALKGERDGAERLEEVEAAAAGVGHRLQQVLVIAEADAEAGGGDVARGQLAHMGGDLVQVGEAFIGLTVAEQERAAEVLAIGIGDLAAAPHPAIEEVGGAARGDALDGGFGLGAVGGGHGQTGRDQVDLAVVHDDGGAVALAEHIHQMGRGLLGVVQLLALHRAAAVDDERQRERALDGPALGRGEGDLENARAGRSTGDQAFIR